MTATLFSGAESHTGEVLVGLTIAQARAKFQTAWGIPPQNYPTVNGRRVDDTYVIRDEDEVVLTRPSGEKG